MNDDHDEEVQSLIEELERLQLRIGAVNQRLRNLERRRHDTVNPETDRTDNDVVGSRSRRSKREKEGHKGRKTIMGRTEERTFKVGDKVRVLNPTKKQPIDTGKVTGYTRNGYIRFTLDDGIETCRASKNLELIASVNERN